ncbi:Gfo/Idh/MocA family protein [Paenibacillus cellulositrophicus]|uniref:Gfo/Idh/MocA family protein n=1 Tax=Paenibacillus cellulositrophicus TaxID=562959 RepID=UPI001266F6EC|nr:Gfo/Idh/MocA family oxidoreductase [Paenibacillus cellulositrophicus]
MIHVLVIGAGAMGSTHAAAYADMPNAHLAGIVDTDAGKGARVAEACGTSSFTSYAEAMEALDRVDVVDVCLPTPLHKKFVLRAADDGKHVICEKPLARSLADAREMIDHCRSRGVRLFVGHVLRFFHEYAHAKQLLDDGVIGKPAVIRAGRGGGYPIGWQHWYSDFGASGGITLDAMIHDFDFLRWCFGEVERVYAKGLHGRVHAQLDYSLVTLRFQSGAIAHVEGTWSHEGFSMNLEMAGTQGIIGYDSARDQPLLSFQRGGHAGGGGGVPVPESPVEENPYSQELRHFLNCIEQDKEPIVTVEDAYEALRIALSALKSMETGRPVHLGTGAADPSSKGVIGS